LPIFTYYFCSDTDFESVGRRFESCRAYQKNKQVVVKR
jgi:hypothetical protein